MHVGPSACCLAGQHAARRLDRDRGPPLPMPVVRALLLDLPRAQAHRSASRDGAAGAEPKGSSKRGCAPPPLTDPASFLVETPASPPTAECPPCPTTVPRPQPSWAARWWRTRAALARARRNSPTSSPPLSTEAHPISFWIFFHARRGIGEGGRLGALSPPLASNASARSRRPCQTVARPSNLARQG